MPFSDKKKMHKKHIKKKFLQKKMSLIYIHDSHKYCPM